LFSQSWERGRTSYIFEFNLMTFFKDNDMKKHL
jgi:hypothetical protein